MACTSANLFLFPVMKLRLFGAIACGLLVGVLLNEWVRGLVLQMILVICLLKHVTGVIKMYELNLLHQTIENLSLIHI